MESAYVLAPGNLSNLRANSLQPPATETSCLELLLVISASVITVVTLFINILMLVKTLEPLPSER
jgi:hypothetical protein